MNLITHTSGQWRLQSKERWEKRRLVLTCNRGITVQNSSGNCVYTADADVPEHANQFEYCLIFETVFVSFSLHYSWAVFHTHESSDQFTSLPVCIISRITHKTFCVCVFCTESAQLCKIMFNTETECIISLYQHNCFTYCILAYIQWLIVYHTSFLCGLSKYLLRKCMHVAEMPVKEHIIWKATHSKHISWQTFYESVDSHLPNV